MSAGSSETHPHGGIHYTFLRNDIEKKKRKVIIETHLLCVCVYNIYVWRRGKKPSFIHYGDE